MSMNIQAENLKKDLSFFADTTSLSACKRIYCYYISKGSAQRAAFNTMIASVWANIIGSIGGYYASEGNEFECLRNAFQAGTAAECMVMVGMGSKYLKQEHENYQLWILANKITIIMKHSEIYPEKIRFNNQHIDKYKQKISEILNHIKTDNLLSEQIKDISKELDLLRKSKESCVEIV